MLIEEHFLITQVYLSFNLLFFIKLTKVGEDEY